MDTYEATRAVLTRIQNLDPDNASKIMGMLLIQDHGEKEMIRLAFGPESLLQSVVLKARKDLGLASNSPSTPSTPSSPSPFPANNHHHTAALSRQNSASSRLPSPLSIPNHSSLSSSSWATSCFSDFQTHDDLISPSSNSTSPFYGNGGTHDLIDDFQLQDQLSFLNDGSSSPNFHPKGSNFLYPYQDLANNSNWGSDESTCGFGWKPCLYYARGYCKNGSTCRFLHGDLAAPGEAVAAGVVENSQDLLRSKQRLAAVASSFPYSSALAANKCMNLLLQQHQSDTQRAAAAALMMGEDMHKLGRSRLERNDFSMSPGSRQIYLTFPADSTFREEDVSNYFSIYGPVQDVRIPYQQKRMFGFVTFVYPDTVKMILAKGNPHFVCDARVLVKPYKEKGKIPDKFRKQPQIERGDFSACGSPTGLDSRSDPFELQLGARLFGNGNSQDILWRRKLEEQAEMQQAIELQGRRLMSLQLLDVKRHNPHGHHRALSTGAAIPSPTHSPSFFNQTLVLPSERGSPEAVKENGFLSNPAMAVSATVVADQESKEAANVTEKEKEKASPSANGTLDNGSGKHIHEESDLPESLDHNLNLPDSPFASPKAVGDFITAFNPVDEAGKTNSASASSSANSSLITSALLPATSTLDMASFNSCYFQAPRFSSGHGAIGM